MRNTITKDDARNYFLSGAEFMYDNGVWKTMEYCKGGHSIRRDWMDEFINQYGKVTIDNSQYCASDYSVFFCKYLGNRENK